MDLRLRWRGDAVQDAAGVKGIWNSVDRAADCLAQVVVSGRQAKIYPKASKIDDLTVFPNGSNNLRYPCQRIDQTVLCLTDDLPVRIHVVTVAAGALWKRAEVGQDTVLPLECVLNEAVEVEAVWGVWIGNGCVRGTRGRPPVVHDSAPAG